MPDVSAPIAEEGKQTSSRKKRAWPVTAAGILLILQAVFLFCLFPVLVGIEIYQLPDAKLAWLLTTEGRLAPMHVDIVDLRQLQITLVYELDEGAGPGSCGDQFPLFPIFFPHSDQRFPAFAFMAACLDYGNILAGHYPGSFIVYLFQLLPSLYLSLNGFRNFYGFLHEHLRSPTRLSELCPT